ncbi:MAG: S9 family peptidase, partial [Parcubacteria group bacterium SW_4_46_8]
MNDIFIYEIGTGEITKIIDGDEFYSGISFLQDRAILYTNYQADNGRILSSSYEDLFQPIDQWQELISERGYPLKSFTVTANKIIVHYLVDVTSEVVAFDHDGNKQSEFPLPENSSMIGIRTDRKENRFFYSVDSFIQTRTTYEFDPKADEHIVYRQEDNPLNPDNYVVTQEWCESHDSTEVPMFVIRHEDVEPDGENPTILYGYGGYGISKTPGFSRTRVSWLNRGGVFVIANVRGGGEFGESWHKNGIKENKPNTFKDLIAAGEHLIDRGYTNSQKLGIYGGSNGGLTVGATATMRPDLLQAVCADVPLLDTVRFHKFGMAVRWIHEYGNPENKKDLERILEWSPYHNV